MKKSTAAAVGILLAGIIFSGCSNTDSQPVEQGVKPAEVKQAPVSNTDTGKSEELLGKVRSQVTVYFQDTKGKYLLPVNIAIEPNDHAAKVALEKLLAGPDSERVKPVMPAGTKLRELYLKDNTAFVSLTQEFLNLSNAKSAEMAIKAVVLTLTEFSVVQNVQLLVDGQDIGELHGIEMGKSVKRPAAINGPQYEDMVLVYYANNDASMLIPYSVQVGEEDPMKAALQALLDGPPARTQGELVPTIWPDTEILDIRVNGKTLVVDLTKEVVGYGGGSTAENMLVDSLVATMTQFPEITQVQLLIEGKQISALPEGTDISKPLQRSFNNLSNL